MVVETPTQKGSTMNKTMRYEMYKCIKPQDIGDTPQFGASAAAAAAAVPRASTLPSPYLAFQLPEFAAAALSPTSHFQPLAFSPSQCPHVTLQGFSDPKKSTPHS